MPGRNASGNGLADPGSFLDVSPQLGLTVSFSRRTGRCPGVEHLLSLGHQRIALLAGPESSVSARARLAGWKTTLAQAGVEAFAVAQGDWSAASGYEKGHQLGGRAAAGGDPRR